MKITSVIFDLDGTLVDSVKEHGLAWQHAFEHFGIVVDLKTMERQIGKGGDEIQKSFLSEQQINAFGQQMKDWRSEHFRENYLKTIKPFPAATALLRELKSRGFKLAVGSSAHKEDLQFYLDQLEAQDIFDVVTSSDDADRSKPHPDIFEVALEKLQTSTEETIVIGDSPYDAEAAKKAGLASIGFLSGGFTEFDLRSAGVSDIFQNPADMLNRIDESILSGAVRAK